MCLVWSTIDTFVINDDETVGRVGARATARRSTTLLLSSSERRLTTLTYQFRFTLPSLSDYYLRIVRRLSSFFTLDRCPFRRCPIVFGFSFARSCPCVSAARSKGCCDIGRANPRLLEQRSTIDDRDVD